MAIYGGTDKLKGLKKVKLPLHGYILILKLVNILF